MAFGGVKKGAAWFAAAGLIVGAGFWAAATFTSFNPDPRIAQIKAAAVDLLTREQSLGVVSPKLAAKLHSEKLDQTRLDSIIQEVSQAKGAEYRSIFTPQRAAYYQRLTAKGLHIWANESRPRESVSSVHLQVDYWIKAQITNFGAWVKLRGAMHSVVKGRDYPDGSATFYLRLVGNPNSGYKISNEKWLGYNPS